MFFKKTPLFELCISTLDLIHFVVKTNNLLLLQNDLQLYFTSYPNFFSNETVVIDLRNYLLDQKIELNALNKLLNDFSIKPIGAIGNNNQREWIENSNLTLIESHSHYKAKLPECLPTLIIERPIRSGQIVYFEGNIVILGLVSCGAEIIAGGNIYIYAPLRGRALAGVYGNLKARIFCTCLESELIAIAGIYKKMEYMPNIAKQSVQVRLDTKNLLVIELLCIK